MTVPSATEVLAELATLGTVGRAEHEKAYLRSELEHLGVPVPAIRKVAVRIGRADELDRPTRDRLVEALWASGVHEGRVASVELLVARVDELTPADLPLLERLLRSSGTWALVDTLAIRALGPLVEREPALLDELDRWTADDDLWIRRSALLALLLPLRRGDGEPDLALRWCDRLLDETEFFIRKAVGWLLREMSRERPDLVADWLESRVDRASGVTWREAVKRLDPDRRAELESIRRR